MTVSPLHRLRDVALPEQFLMNENLSVAWQSPSNIAIVKYWGKKNGQIPATTSLGMTLDRANTQTRVQVLIDQPVKGLVSVNGDPNHPFLPKMRQLLQWMADEIPVLNRITLAATTANSFPHSTGIASSASGISAFTLCLLSIAGKMLNIAIANGDLMHMASYAARMGSGSACRSLFGGFTVWGESSLVHGSSDEFAIPVSASVHPDMLSLRDTILVVSSFPKSLPSAQGHKSMNGHPFLDGRIGQANENLGEALHALTANDFEKLCTVAECEAFTLHALLMSANPGILLMKPATVEVIHRVREARKNGLPLFFTLDAGANVHVLYPADSADIVEKFIIDALQPLCEAGRMIYDGCGKGPVRLRVYNLNP
jgi:diphosphomevalonate decarboxylase